MNRSIARLSAVSASCLLLAGCSSTGTGSSSLDSGVVTKQDQSAMTPDQVISELKAGNKRFVNGKLTSYDWNAQAKQTAEEGQFPKAIILSCLDSRVPVEVVFDQGIGDVFVGRVAGNFENTDMLGSMEFGAKLAGSKAIVVLGHSQCGAVKGAMAGAEMGNLTETLDNIEPAIKTVANKAGTKPDAGNADHVALVVEANVRQTVKDITSRSSVMAELIESGDLKVVGAVYDLATGKVTWLDS